MTFNLPGWAIQPTPIVNPATGPRLTNTGRAVARVLRYLDARDRMDQLDDAIHETDGGEPRGTTLRASDLRALVDAVIGENP